HTALHLPSHTTLLSTDVPSNHNYTLSLHDALPILPQGKDVVTALGKGDAVVSGAETQAWQAQGIIPQFAKGTPGKKKKLIDVAGGEFGKLVGKGANTADQAMDTRGSATKAGKKVGSEKGEDRKEGMREAMTK